MKYLAGVLASFWFAASTCAMAASPAERSRSQPNILLILLDDAGYADIAGFADSKAPTPTLKQFGDDGVRFTRFYADSTCRPARVALLTGKQASRVTLAPDFHGLSPEVQTLPEQLKKAGYTTHHIGKWHLGDTVKAAWPSQHGFDDWFGFLTQFYLRGPNKAGEMVPHRPTYTDPWLQENDAAAVQHPGHLEDILAERVVATIKAHQNDTAPWFINYWTFAPHNPAIPSQEFREQFPAGKAGQYAALLKQLDTRIGDILAALDETGQADNTLVLIMSDNGGTNQFDDNNGPFEGEKGQYGEGGTRVPLMVRWPGRVKVGAHYDGVTALYDIYPTLLAAAGLPADTTTDGIDLVRALAQKTPTPRADIFWETGDNYNYSWSVLADDGRWRLDDGKELFDLKQDPSAHKDIAALQPDKVAELKRRFVDWRKQAHALALASERLADANPAWRLTGDSFRRTPGHGGFTVVTSLTPGKLPPRGTLFEQAGLWRLVLGKDRRLVLTMHDQELVSKPVSIQGCTPLVFSSYYFRSKLLPGQDHAIWTIRVGDEEVLLEKRPKPAVFPERFAEPTYAGRDTAGKQPFTGVMEAPQFYNDFFYPNDPWQVDRDPMWLEAGMCRDTHNTVQK